MYLSLVVSVEGPWNCIPLVRLMVILVIEEFEDTKVIIRNRNSTDKQYNNKGIILNLNRYRWPVSCIISDQASYYNLLWFGFVYIAKRHYQQYFSYISWRSVLLVEETEVSGENHRPVASHWQTLSHNAVSSTSKIERLKKRVIEFEEGRTMHTISDLNIVHFYKQVYNSNKTTQRNMNKWQTMAQATLLLLMAT